jgi:DNA-directed RNA polymerase specialized sigma24 family protein
MILCTGVRTLAQEATDEAFTRALIKWEQVSGMTSPSAWVFSVARNHARRIARRASLEQTLLRRATVVVAVPGPAGEIWEVVKALPERQRAVIVMRYVLDLPELAIANALGVRRGTVSAHHSAALAHLRSQLVTIDVMHEVRQ